MAKIVINNSNYPFTQGSSPNSYEVVMEFLKSLRDEDGSLKYDIKYKISLN